MTKTTEGKTECKRIDHRWKATGLVLRTAEQFRCVTCDTFSWMGAVKHDVDEALRLQAVKQ